MSYSPQTDRACQPPVTQDLAHDPIDAVITWVDGAAPAHRARRARYMAQTQGDLNENATNPHRWESSDEITYCLRSIHIHAPWITRIWIVVEEDTLDLSDMPHGLRDKIRIVLHAQIFAGHTEVLPTFNSLAIESMLWRIDGLSERFLYFNDDVFLTNPLRPQDVFEGNAPVLRGRWLDLSALRGDRDARADPALFNYFMHINAAALCGYGAEHLFVCAHVAHPLRRSVMAELFERHRDAFLDNISHRFRDISQFLPQGAHTHLSILSGDPVFSGGPDHRHIKSGQGAGTPPEQTRTLLTREALAGVKFLCVNDLPQLEALVPDARRLIAAATGG